jgi:hypothetical protein
MRPFHLLIRFDDICAVSKSLVEVSHIHEVLIVVHKYLLLVYFHEAGTLVGQDMSGPRVVGKSKDAVVHVERWLVAVSNLEPLLVPVDH